MIDQSSLINSSLTNCIEIRAVRSHMCITRPIHTHTHRDSGWIDIAGSDRWALFPNYERIAPNGWCFHLDRVHQRVKAGFVITHRSNAVNMSKSITWRRCTIQPGNDWSVGYVFRPTFSLILDAQMFTSSDWASRGTAREISEHDVDSSSGMMSIEKPRKCRSGFIQRDTHRFRFRHRLASSFHRCFHQIKSTNARSNLFLFCCTTAMLSHRNRILGTGEDGRPWKLFRSCRYQQCGVRFNSGYPPVSTQLSTDYQNWATCWHLIWCANLGNHRCKIGFFHSWNVIFSLVLPSIVIDGLGLSVQLLVFKLSWKIDLEQWYRPMTVSSSSNWINSQCSSSQP